MYLIATFGILMMFFSAIMGMNPYSFSKGIISFSEKNYFHLFEISTRIIAGIIFIIYAKDTLYPSVFMIVGCVLILVGVGLSLTPPKLHKKFAVWSANRLRNMFRFIGIISMPVSLLLIYASIGAANR